MQKVLSSAVVATIVAITQGCGATTPSLSVLDQPADVILDYIRNAIS
jgi:hypothetical protein